MSFHNYKLANTVFLLYCPLRIKINLNLTNPVCELDSVVLGIIKISAEMIVINVSVLSIWVFCCIEPSQPINYTLNIVAEIQFKWVKYIIEVTFIAEFGVQYRDSLQNINLRNKYIFWEYF